MVDASTESYVSAGYEVTVWIHASAALGCLLVAAVAHYRVQPYRFGFQNRLEFRLYLAGASIVLLAIAYTFVPNEHRSWAEPLVETLLVALLVVPALIAVL